MLSKLKYMSVFLNKYAKSPLFNLINSNCIMQMKDKEKELAQLETLGSVPIYHSITQSPRVTCESNISVLSVFENEEGSTIISIPIARDVFGYEVTAVSLEKKDFIDFLDRKKIILSCISVYMNCH